ncbi:EamA family transporter RarD [Leucobacter sp. gxy201]|uniref:EamA family transporter RarD n=1 Tax=Leucobacter sp. gxy201 TaxID=2957200 RepID=UPI003DA014B8
MSSTRTGLAFGIGAYAFWGAFPFYFTLIAVVNPLEVVPWRVATTFAVCIVAVTVLRRWRLVRAILRTPKQFGWFALSSLMLYANWQIFIIGVITGHVIETALGYFINPLFTIVLGVIFLKERLSRLQWTAVAIAAVSVLVSAIAYGSFPWIALGLAFSFGMYGLLRKRTGEVDGITGLMIETLASAPIAVVQLVLVGVFAGLTGLSHGTGITVLLMLSGVMTAIPLVLFGEAARRLPLSTLGFIQFLTPIINFLYGYFVLHEEMTFGRWAGFLGVWCALAILVFDMVRTGRRQAAVFRE